MYYFVFLILLFASLIEIRTGRINSRLFYLVFLIITAMSVFRYGQGTDYFNYEGLFNGFCAMCDTAPAYTVFIAREPGYNLIQFCGYLLNLDYVQFVGLVALGTMFCFYKFLKRECSLSIFSLFCFYVLFYMTYELSAIRQGIVMSLFFLWSYPLIKQRKILKYIFSIIVLATIHTSAIILLFIIFFEKLSIGRKNIKIYFIISVFLLFVGQPLLSKLPFVSFFSDHLEETASSNFILAKAIRIIVVAFILFFPAYLFKDNNKEYLEKKYLVYGFFVYTLCSFSELASSRVWAYFLGFEIMLLGKMSTNFNKSRLKKQFLYLFAIILSILWIKDVNGYIKQANYRNCNLFSYPYITVFEGDDVLLRYRDKN